MVVVAVAVADPVDEGSTMKEEVATCTEIG